MSMTRRRLFQLMGAGAAATLVPLPDVKGEPAPASKPQKWPPKALDASTIRADAITGDKLTPVGEPFRLLEGFFCADSLRTMIGRLTLVGMHMASDGLRSSRVRLEMELIVDLDGYQHLRSVLLNERDALIYIDIDALARQRWQGMEPQCLIARTADEQVLTGITSFSMIHENDFDYIE